ncbi:lipopolysaccharide assembly LapA domain-containing protein [Pseudalkalibacillus sp. SCS-8]|uniref:LapA family protein n=1 Tax=Pseudalkalibacillus nanhaiensis TaxID=3115291 RepID=UPI0032DB7856
MRREWSYILVLLFAIIVAVFAVINVEAVEVDYLFGTAQWPLVLVILGSALIGALSIGIAGSVRFMAMRKELRSLRKENEQYKAGFESKSQTDENQSEATKETVELPKDTSV